MKKKLFESFFLILLSVLPLISHAQVQVPEVSEEQFSESHILSVFHGGSQIGTLCREYLSEEPSGGKVYSVFYRSNPNGDTDFSRGYLLGESAEALWDLSSNKVTITRSSKPYQGVFLNQNLDVLYQPISGAVKATLQPLLLVDKRLNESISYGQVKIGNQIWMRENLATSCWRDGTPIRTGLSKDEWWSTTQAAYSIYDNDPNNLKTFGGLYNFFAVADSRGLEPEGWSIPSDEEWHSLMAYLDPSGIDPDPDDWSRESEKAGAMIKSTSEWKAAPYPEPGAVLKQGNNLSGLNVRPTGSTSTSKYMDYSGKGLQAYFWSRSTYDDQAMFRRVYWDQDITNRFHEKKQYGYSVRCMRPATSVTIESPKSVGKVQIKSLIDATTPFIFRAVSPSGSIRVIDALGKEQTLQVAQSIDHLVGGAGTLLSLPASEANQTLTIEGDLLYIDLSGQKISQIDFEKAETLQAIILNLNEITQLDASKLPNLEVLYAHSNKLQSINLTGLTKLKELILLSNQLTDIDLSPLSSLEVLGVAMNQLESLSLSNTPKVTHLDCQRNKIKSIDIAHLTQLQELNCRKNKITTLAIDALPNLKKIDCAENSISTLNISQLKDLVELNCNTNEIAVLDLQGKSKLEELYAFGNKISQISLKEAENIRILSIGDNQISSIDLSDLSQLEEVSVPFNKLKQIQIKNCPVLQAFSAMANELASVQVENCPALRMIEINHNKITQPLPILSGLPKYNIEEPGYIIFRNSSEFQDLTEQNVISDQFISEAQKIGWLVLDGEKPIETGFESPSELSIKITPIGQEGCFRIDAPEVEGWTIYDMKGSIVSTHRNSTDGIIRLSSKPQGSYLIVIKLAHGATISTKLIR